MKTHSTLGRLAAFTAASIGSELAALLAPILSNIFPSLHSEEAASGENNVLSADIDDVLPAIANAAAYLDGKKIERMMTRLLIENDNVSVQGAATGGSVQKADKGSRRRGLLSESYKHARARL